MEFFNAKKIQSLSKKLAKESKKKIEREREIALKKKKELKDADVRKKIKIKEENGPRIKVAKPKGSEIVKRKIIDRETKVQGTQEKKIKRKARIKLENKKQRLYARIKRLGLKINFTGDIDADIKTFLSLMDDPQKRVELTGEDYIIADLPLNQQKRRSVKGRVVSTAIDNQYDINHTIRLSETNTIKKQAIQYSSPLSKKNNQSGMAFDRFEYGLD